MKHLLALLLVAVFATFTFAEDAKPAKKDKAPWQVTKIKKMLKPVTLTTEQETGFAEALQTFKTRYSELKGKGLTKEKIKSRAAKRKEGRESGLKGKDLHTYVNEGVSEEEQDMFKELEKSNKDLEKTVAKMLTPEQMSSLPEKVQKRMTMLTKAGKGGKGGKGKKKKAAQEE